MYVNVVYFYFWCGYDFEIVKFDGFLCLLGNGCGMLEVSGFCANDGSIVGLLTVMSRIGSSFMFFRCWGTAGVGFILVIVCFWTGVLL